MIHIKKMKTWNGLRYAVVEPIKIVTEDENKNLTTRIEYHAVEYKVSERDVRVATFPVTEEGLHKAKEIQRLFKKWSST